MNRVLKTFLLWLLIAALPIQGMAAVVKASCGPGHHDALPVAMNAVEHHDHDDTGSVPHQHGHDDAMLAMADNAVASASTDEPAAGSQHIHKSSYCSACAACCFGAVAPPPSLSFTSGYRSFEIAVIPPAVSYTGFIPAGPERPPRHFFA